MRAKATRIFWCHPCLRDYRKPFFDRVQSKYKVRFFFWRESEMEHEYDAVYADKRLAGRTLSPRDIGCLYRGIRDSDVFVSSFLCSDYSIAGILIARLLGKKVIVWEELSLFLKGCRSAIRRWGSGTIAKYVDAFFVLGEPHRQALCKLGVSRERVFLANEYPGYVYSDVEPAPIESLAIDGKAVILYLGRFVPVKGLEYLLEAYRLLEEKRSDTLLLIVGYGPLEDQLKREANNLRIKSIRFLDRITDVRQKKYLFDISRVMVVPSIIRERGSIEGGPMVVLEALSAGTPVVGTDGMMSSRQFISDGVNGFVIPHSDPRALCEKMEEIVRWGNSQEIRERVRAEFRTIQGFDHQFEVIENAIRYCFEGRR